jgi:hypothetical protein
MPSRALFLRLKLLYGECFATVKINPLLMFREPFSYFLNHVPPLLQGSAWIGFKRGDLKPPESTIGNFVTVFTAFPQ